MDHYILYQFAPKCSRQRLIFNVLSIYLHRPYWVTVLEDIYVLSGYTPGGADGYKTDSANLFCEIFTSVLPIMAESLLRGFLAIMHVLRVFQNLLLSYIGIKCFFIYQNRNKFTRHAWVFCSLF